MRIFALWVLILVYCVTGREASLVTFVGGQPLACTPGNKYDSGADNCTQCGWGTYEEASNLDVTCQTCQSFRNFSTHELMGQISNSSCECDRGYTLSGSDCVACGFGSYSPNITDDACATCPDPNHSTDTETATTLDECLCKAGYTNSSSSCAECEIGYYKTSTANEPCSLCSDLDLNSNTTRTGANETSYCVCDSGYEGEVGAGCTQCLVGYYKDAASADNCTYCDNGRTTENTGSTTSSDCVCDLGFKDNNATHCSLCEISTFKNITGNAATCYVCPANTNTTIEGATSISDCVCVAGYESDGAGGCTPCPYSEYNDILNGTCTACPANQNTTAVASDSPGLCICGAGWTRDGIVGDACSECGFGKFKNVSGDESCTNCTLEGQSTIGNTSTDETQCLCMAGYEPDGSGGCQKCGYGFYKNNVSDTSCVPCDSGRNTTVLGASDASFCTCDAGKEDVNGVCELCQNGYYKPGVSADNCTACSTDGSETTLNNGSMSESDCKCNPGYYQNETSPLVCVACELGSYRDSINTDAYPCTSCPAGSTTEYTASNDSTDCLCELGLYDLSGSCANCPSGTYKDVPGDELSACTNCTTIDPNMITDGDGKNSSSDCVCKLGWFGSGSCTACSKGSYRESLSEAACTPCSDPLQDTPSDAADNSTLCMCRAGYYYDGSNCAVCPAGTYKSDVSNGDLSSCLACPAASTTENNATSDVADCVCGPGLGWDGTLCTNCIAGYYREGYANSTCLACEDTYPNTITDSQGSDSPSLCICKMGYGSDTSSNTDCTSCVIGSFKYSTGNDNCTTCNSAKSHDTTVSDGWSTLNTTSTAESDCVCNIGHLKNADACEVCPSGGKYQDEKGIATACKTCPSGVIVTTPTTGATSINNCGCGLGLELDAANSVCASCQIGFYSNETSINPCYECVAPRTTAAEGADDISDCQCPVGNYADGTGTCVQCPANTHKSTVSDLNSECVSCGLGEASPQGTTNATECYCTPGYSRPDGTQSGTDCSKCGIGFYSTTNDAATCDQCPSPFTTETETAKLPTDCVCPPGYVVDREVFGTNKCFKMAYPYYVSTSNSTVCSVCDRGTITPVRGASSASQCVPIASNRRNNGQVFVVRLVFRILRYINDMNNDDTAEECVYSSIISDLIELLFSNLGGRSGDVYYTGTSGGKRRKRQVTDQLLVINQEIEFPSETADQVTEDYIIETINTNTGELTNLGLDVPDLELDTSKTSISESFLNEETGGICNPDYIWPPVVVCFNQCSSDSDCPGIQKCCSDPSSCSSECQDTVQPITCEDNFVPARDVAGNILSCPDQCPSGDEEGCRDIGLANDVCCVRPTCPSGETGRQFAMLNSGASVGCGGSGSGGGGGGGDGPTWGLNAVSRAFTLVEYNVMMCCKTCPDGLVLEVDDAGVPLTCQTECQINGGNCYDVGINNTTCCIDPTSAQCPANSAITYQTGNQPIVCGGQFGTACPSGSYCHGPTWSEGVCCHSTVPPVWMCPVASTFSPEK